MRADSLDTLDGNPPLHSFDNLHRYPKTQARAGNIFGFVILNSVKFAE